MKFKEFGVEYKDAGNGSIEGYASTWVREPDSYGDVVKAGAFSRTLEERWNGGKGIPLLWAHQMDNISSYIGTANAIEDDKGLFFNASFDDTDEAQRVRDLYKDGRLSKFSFAFDVRESGGVVLEDGKKANELRDLELYEISCVCVPANDDAGVVAVKSIEPAETPEPADPDVKSEEADEKTVEIVPIMTTEEKAGRRNSRKDADAIREAIALLQGVLGELDDTEEDEPEDGEDEVKANGAPEEPEQSNPKKDALLSVIAKIREEE